MKAKSAGVACRAEAPDRRPAINAAEDRPAVLCFLPHYLPGYRAGGPTRSVANIVEQLGDDYRFRIITSDRDFGAAAPYPDVVRGEWTTFGKADVLYLNPADCFVHQLRDVIRATPHDIRYYNSLCSPRFTILPLVMTRLGSVAACPSIIAPRGELAESALRLKPWRKKAYLGASRILQLHANCIWQATSPHEALDIRRHIGLQATVFIAPNLACVSNSPPPHDARAAQAPLRVLFLSRIARMKNLAFVLKVLATVRADVSLRIVGTLEDCAYWKECEALIKKLPANITVSCEGSIEPNQVAMELATNDVLFLPTLGENFGHVIFESLAVGTPVLISDRTCWRGLQQAGVGWDISLNQPEAFAAILESLAETPCDETVLQRKTCFAYAVAICSDPQSLHNYRTLFSLRPRQATAANA